MSVQRAFARVGFCAAASLGGLTFQRPTRAAVYFNDTFDVAGATRDNDSSDPADIPWFQRGTNGAGFTIVTDNAAGATGKALRYAPNPTNLILLASFDANVADGNPATSVGPTSSNVALAAAQGSMLRLQLNFRYETLPSGGGLRIGFYVDPDGPAIIDNSGTATNNSTGYYGLFATGTSGNGSFLRKESGTDVSVMNGTDGVDLASDPNQPAINDTNWHKLQLLLSRNAGGAHVSLYLDDLINPVLAADDATPYTTFNMLTLESNVDNVSFLMDNATLDTVPEPTSAGLLAAGSVALAGLRRRRREIAFHARS